MNGGDGYWLSVESGRAVVRRYSRQRVGLRLVMFLIGWHGYP